MFLYNNIF
jgi:hypothetical protein